MVKNKTKTVSLSTLLVTILAILAIVLGGLFVSNAVNSTTTVRANDYDFDHYTYYGSSSEYYDEEGADPNASEVYGINPNMEAWGRAGESGTLLWAFRYDNSIEEDYGILTIFDKRVIEQDYLVKSGPWAGMDVSRPWYEFTDYVNEVVFSFGASGNPTKIGDYALNGLEIWDEDGEFNVWSSVTSIGKYSFSSNGRRDYVNGNYVYIPSSVTYIGTFDHTFDCLRVVYAGTVQHWYQMDRSGINWAYEGDYVLYCNNDEDEEINEDTRWSYEDGTLTIYSASIVEADWNSYHLPWSESNLEYNLGLFSENPRVTNVVFDSGVNPTAIGDSVFWGFGGETIVIPSSVTSIGENAFSWCENLADVYYAGSSTDISISNRAFFGSSIRIHCQEDNKYKDVTNGTIEATWHDETPAPAPATGIELNIGVAIASLALVGTMFVVANKKRKEDR